MAASISDPPPVLLIDLMLEHLMKDRDIRIYLALKGEAFINDMREKCQITEQHFKDIAFERRHPAMVAWLRYHRKK